MRIDISNTAIRELMRNASLIADKTAATKDACNSAEGRDDFEYEIEVTAIRARGRVWAPAGADGNALVRNLGG